MAASEPPVEILSEVEAPPPAQAHENKRPAQATAYLPITRRRNTCQSLAIVVLNAVVSPGSSNRVMDRTHWARAVFEAHWLQASSTMV
jgi:hypothetical protein